MYKLMMCALLLSSALYGNSGLDRLMRGNKYFVDTGFELLCQKTQDRRALISRQEPFAIIVGCSDSRVPPELIFNQGFGDLFVVRVAGNVIGPIELDSIEFSATYLRSSVILVLGHENCGAVEAVIEGTTKDIENVAALIAPAVEGQRKRDPENLLEASTKANARRMRDYLLKSPVIKKLVSNRKLEVYAGYYHQKTGLVELL